MEVSELRIGNFFQYGKQNRIAVVYTILFDRIEEYSINNDIPFSHVKSIELTEEWLTNFGFEHSGDYYVKDQVYIMIKSYLEPRSYHYKFNYTAIDIDSVHHLQNLYFSLVGKELTLNKPL